MCLLFFFFCVRLWYFTEHISFFFLHDGLEDQGGILGKGRGHACIAGVGWDHRHREVVDCVVLCVFFACLLLGSVLGALDCVEMSVCLGADGWGC